MRTCSLAPIVFVLAAAAGVAGPDDAIAPTGAVKLADAVTPIIDLRQRAIDEMQAHPPVRIRGVVTWQAKRAMVIVQDETSAIFCFLHSDVAGDEPIEGGLDAAIVPGTEVEIEGTGDWGGFGPRVRITKARPLGPAPLPEPRVVDPTLAAQGAHDVEFVRFQGVVLGWRAIGDEMELLLEAGGRSCSVFCSAAAVPADPERLIDAVVTVDGVVFPRSNTRGECLEIYLVSVPTGGVRVVAPAPEMPFESPRVALQSIARFTARQRPGRIVQTEGTVIHAVPGEAIFLQDGAGGIVVKTDSREPVTAGDRVAVAGFPDFSGPVAGLKHAQVRRLASGPAPEPRAIAPAEIVAVNMRSHATRTIAEPGDFVGCLVRHPATLVEVRPTEAGGELLLRAGDALVTARLRRNDFGRLAALAAGSELDVTGIVEPGWSRDPRAPPDRIGLLVRSAADVRLLRPASWWTPRRLLVTLGAVAGILVAAVIWALTLRHEVGVQARRLARAIERRREAAIEFRAAVAERNRLANNLHDTLLQGLAGAVLQLDACRYAIAGGRPEVAEGQIEKSKRMVQHAANDLRNSVWALRVAPLEGRTLGESLEIVAGHLTVGDAPRIAVRAEGGLPPLPEFVSGNLLLVAQEAIRNALHHAACERIDVEAAWNPRDRVVSLTVRDDGRGFDPAAAAGTDRGHFGLQVMRERIAGIGGTLAIDTAPGRGTTVTAMCKVGEATPADA
jgi:signal transduction histidine kinase